MLSRWPSRRKATRSACFLDREAGQGDCFRVADAEYRRQLGDLQDFLELSAR
jgi:hypothetical protein